MVEQQHLYEEPSDRSGVDGQHDGTREDGGTESATPSFEEAFARLEEIVERLEQGQASLEESLRLFEEGTALARLSRQHLDRVERRIRVLVDGREDEGTERVASALEREVEPRDGDRRG